MDCVACILYLRPSLTGPTPPSSRTKPDSFRFRQVKIGTAILYWLGKDHGLVCRQKHRPAPPACGTASNARQPLPGIRPHEVHGIRRFCIEPCPV